MDQKDPRLRATLPHKPEQATDASAERGKARLVFVDGPRRGEIIELEDRPLRVGRQLDNELVIDSERVSRHHARFERSSNTWSLVDLSSVNGTSVNGTRLAANRLRGLHSRDVIQLPESTLIFLADDAPGASRSGRTLETIHLDGDRIRAEADEAIQSFLDRSPSRS